MEITEQRYDGRNIVRIEWDGGGVVLYDTTIDDLGTPLKAFRRMHHKEDRYIQEEDNGNDAR